MEIHGKAVVVQEGSDSVYESAVVLAVLVKNAEKNWILDLGCFS